MFSRRKLLETTSCGFGYLAFAALAHAQSEKETAKPESPLSVKKPHFKAKAKRVIFLCMEGGPSHVDTFDYKPRLNQDDGKTSTVGQGVLRGGKLLGSPFKFSQQGNSGLWISELFPELSKHADELCVLNGMHTNLPNHAQAFLQMHCGIFQFPRPSIGSWILYGLGSSNQNLPGFVTINPPVTNGGTANYGASFLPPVYQGTRIGRGASADGELVSNLVNRKRSLQAQRIQLDLAQELNRESQAKLGKSTDIDGLIDSFELAFRMQSEFPQLLDITKESPATLSMYGIDSARDNGPRGGGGAVGGIGAANFGRQCLLARKLVEAGVRFVEVTLGGWDHHRALKESLGNHAKAIDKPISGLLTDLKNRGLLEDTLILWGGEFGRTPHAQGDGRDHNNKGFSMWLAGGGVKGGMSFGKTDDYGYEAVEGKVHIHDWHATILHLLGLDHEKLTYKHASRDVRLTDVKGNVVRGILS